MGSPSPVLPPVSFQGTEVGNRVGTGTGTGVPRARIGPSTGNGEWPRSGHHVNSGDECKESGPKCPESPLSHSSHEPLQKVANQMSAQCTTKYDSS